MGSISCGVQGVRARQQAPGLRGGLDVRAMAAHVGWR